MDDPMLWIKAKVGAVAMETKAVVAMVTKAGIVAMDTKAGVVAVVAKVVGCGRNWTIKNINEASHCKDIFPVEALTFSTFLFFFYRSESQDISSKN